MNHSLNLPNRYAMILDTEAINRVIAHAAELKLPRRECHPLDRYRGSRANAALAKYDAEVEAAPVAREELNVIESFVEAEDSFPSENGDFADDEF